MLAFYVGADVGVDVGADVGVDVSAGVGVGVYVYTFMGFESSKRGRVVCFCE